MEDGSAEKGAESSGALRVMADFVPGKAHMGVEGGGRREAAVCCLKRCMPRGQWLYKASSPFPPAGGVFLHCLLERIQVREEGSLSLGVGKREASWVGVLPPTTE